jgi:hypothetical protein
MPTERFWISTIGIKSPNKQERYTKAFWASTQKASGHSRPHSTAFDTLRLEQANTSYPCRGKVTGTQFKYDITYFVIDTIGDFDEF